MIVTKIADLIAEIVYMDIIHIETFTGYKGDTVLKVIVETKEVRNNIAREAHKKGLDMKADYELDGKFRGFYNIFIAYVNNEIYQLKS